MDWCVVQLTSWAEKHLSSQEIIVYFQEKLGPHEIYYPVIEDVAGKHNTAFSEYLFIHFCGSSLDFTDLEGKDVCRKVLRSRLGKFETVTDVQVEDIKNKIKEEQTLIKGDRVKIHSGSLRGNIGQVILSDEERAQTLVLVKMGGEEREAVVPRLWVRKIRRKGQ